MSAWESKRESHSLNKSKDSRAQSSLMKITFFKIVIVTVLLYDVEVWILSAKDKKKFRNLREKKSSEDLWFTVY